MANVVNVNGAGGSTSDPILNGLPITLIMGADTVDIAGQVAAGVDAGQGFPITSAITSSLSPSATTYTPAGLTGTWTNSTRILTVGNVGTADVGMYIMLSSGATKGFGYIEQVVSSTQLKILGGPLTSDASNVGYQIAYNYKGFAGSSVMPSSAAGRLNVLKFQAADSSGNLGNNTPGTSFYIRDMPSDIIVLGGGSYTGQRIATSTPTFEMLTTSNWTNKGGIATLELVSASGITWWDNTTAERTLAAILARGSNDRLKLAGSDGPKSAVFRARSYPASSRYLDMLTMSVTLDASAPAISAWVSAGP